MPVFLERFILPVFAGAVVLLAITNPMSFDRTQRVTGTLTLLFLAYFCAHTVHLYNKAQGKPTDVAPVKAVPTPEQLETTGPQPSETSKPTPTPAAAGQQQSNLGGTNNQQSSSGPNSPNIIGNNNVVLIYPTIDASLPKVRSPHGTASEPKAGYTEKEPQVISFSLGKHGLGTSVSLEKLKEGPYAPFSWYGLFPITIHLKNNVVYCDARLWAGANEPAVEIVNNEFTVRPLGWDVNSTTNALEVVNQDGQPVFQIIETRPRVYVVTGFFAFPNGAALAAGNAMQFERDGRLLSVKGLLQPIFKYPSWKFPGKFEDGSN